MASLCKIPIAAACLKQVQEGRLDLNALHDLSLEDLSPGGTILDLLDLPGLRLSTANLFRLMMQFSDNTSADLLLKAAGGTQAIAQQLALWGLAGIRMDRSVKQALCHQMEVRWPDAIPTMAVFDALNDQLQQPATNLQTQRYLADEKDTATAQAMGALLVRLLAGDLLSPSLTQWLLAIMERCQTGQGRIKALLPRGVVVAHKTGTLSGCSHDAGIILLPEQQGDLVLVVLVQGAHLENGARERVIAEASKVIFDAALASI